MKLKGQWLLSLENKLLTFVLQAERVWGIFQPLYHAPLFLSYALGQDSTPSSSRQTRAHTHTPAVGIPLN